MNKTGKEIFLEAVSDDSGMVSSTRLIGIITIPLLVLTPLFIWAILPGKFDNSITGYVTATLTVIAGLIHMNKREETKENISNSDNKT